MPSLTPAEWIIAAVAAMGIGVSKSGFAGLGLFHVVVFALLFGAKDSTGIVLPMLIVGDACAVTAFQRHARWDYIRRMLPPAMIGVVIGWAMMQRLDESAYKPLIGSVILVLTIMQSVRMFRPQWFGDVPHAAWFAWSLGLLAGTTTMLANAAGPIMAIYFLAISLPKFEFVGTSAWFFLLLNLYKVPFSMQLGLIRFDTLTLNLLLAPVIVLGILLGRKLVQRVPQKSFDAMLLLFAGITALKLLGLFDFA